MTALFAACLARVAAKYHKLGVLDNRNVFLTIVEAGKPIQGPAERVVSARLLVC